MLNKILQTERTTKFINKGYILEGECDQIEILCFCAKALFLQSTVCKVTNK